MRDAAKCVDAADARSRAPRQSGEAKDRLVHTSIAGARQTQRLNTTAATHTRTRMTDAAAQYKKQDGIVSVSADGKTVAWKSASGALPPLSIAIADIGSMSTPRQGKLTSC